MQHPRRTWTTGRLRGTTALNELPPAPPAERMAPLAPLAADDEISLVDLARVIWRHRRGALATFVVIAASGLAAAALLPKKYTYTTTVEVGSRVKDDRIVPIEAPDAALAKLRESYIPRERRRYLEAHPDARGTFKLAARLPAGSQLLVLEAAGPERSAAAYKAVQEQVVQALEADHARLFQNQRSAVELDKQRAEQNLQTLIDEETVLKARLGRLESKAQLLDQQIADTRAQIDNATANRSRAAVGAPDAARAMPLLMLDNEVRENRTRLAELQRQRQIDLAEERDRLDNALRENRRDRALQQAELRQLDLQLENLQETRAVVLGMQSLEPVGTSRALIVLLGILFGSLLALLMPLLLEFAHRVRESVAAQGPDRATGESA